MRLILLLATTTLAVADEPFRWSLDTNYSDDLYVSSDEDSVGTWDLTSDADTTEEVDYCRALFLVSNPEKFAESVFCNSHQICQNMQMVPYDGVNPVRYLFPLQAEDYELVNTGPARTDAIKLTCDEAEELYYNIFDR